MNNKEIEEKRKVENVNEIKYMRHLEYMNDLSKQLNTCKEKILKELFTTIFKQHKDNKIKDYKQFKKIQLKLNREDN